jgi:ribosomal subunit interface protein
VRYAHLVPDRPAGIDIPGHEELREDPMEIAVHGRRVEVTDGLRDSAARKVTRLSKYLSGVERADVLFSDGNGPGAPISCEVTLEARGHVVRASAVAKEPTAALEEAVNTVSHRLVRLKKKLVDRSRPRHSPGSGRAPNGGGPGTEAADTEP